MGGEKEFPRYDREEMRKWLKEWRMGAIRVARHEKLPTKRKN